MEELLEMLIEADRETWNDDGQHFYGFDDEDGRTTWYTDDGTCDCVTDTPYDEW